MNGEPSAAELRDPVARCFRRRLRTAMETGGFDAPALAAAAHTKTNYVNRWLTGVRVPSATNLRSLSVALGVPADWLLGASGEEMLGTLKGLPDRILGPEGGTDGPRRDNQG